MDSKQSAIADALAHPWTWCSRTEKDDSGRPILPGAKVRFIPEENRFEFAAYYDDLKE